MQHSQASLQQPSQLWSNEAQLSTTPANPTQLCTLVAPPTLYNNLLPPLNNLLPPSSHKSPLASSHSSCVYKFLMSRTVPRIQCSKNCHQHQIRLGTFRSRKKHQECVLEIFPASCDLFALCVCPPQKFWRFHQNSVSRKILSESDLVISHFII